MNNNYLSYTEQKKFKLSLAFACSVFLVLFFIFFQPFGVNNYQNELSISGQWLLEMCSFGLPIFLGIIIGEFILQPTFRAKESLLKTILLFIVEFLIVGSLSFIHYNLLGNFHDFHIKSLLLHIINISAVIIFPFLATIFIYRYIWLRKKYNKLSQLSTESTKIKNLILFDGSYKNDKIALLPEQILFINSQDNYACIHYLEKGELIRHMIRSTLSRIEHSIQSQLLIRCHRSYIINLSQIESYKKEKNRRNLKLKHYNKSIPVSKKKIHMIDRLLETYVSNRI